MFQFRQHLPWKLYSRIFLGIFLFDFNLRWLFLLLKPKFYPIFRSLSAYWTTHQKWRFSSKFQNLIDGFKKNTATSALNSWPSRGFINVTQCHEREGNIGRIRGIGFRASKPYSRWWSQQSFKMPWKTGGPLTFCLEKVWRSGPKIVNKFVENPLISLSMRASLFRCRQHLRTLSARGIETSALVCSLLASGWAATVYLKL